MNDKMKRRRNMHECAGGRALLKNLDLLLGQETKLPIRIAAAPLSAVAVGAGEALSNLAIPRNLEK